MESFLDWLLSDAGVGWVGFIGTVIWVFYTRRRPNRVLVRDLEQVALVKVHERVRERLKVEWKGHVINDFAFLRVEVSNQGHGTVSGDLSFEFIFPDGTQLMEATHTSYPESLDIAAGSKPDGTATASIPFLKPYRVHGDRVIFGFLCDGEPTPLRVVGGGKEWSIKRETLAQTRSKISLHMGMTLIIAVLLAFAAVGTLNLYKDELPSLIVPILVIGILATAAFGAGYSQSRFENQLYARSDTSDPEPT